MTFLMPFGLLALLALPAVVWLHLFRNRLPERSIAGAFLFPPQALRAGAGRTRTRLLRTASFWCELLAALSLALWLGGLSFGGVAAHPLVVVLDDSASMGARGARERALAQLRERLAERAPGAFLSILRTGPRPESLLDARERAPDVEAALQRWQPARPRHDVRLSLDLARELAGPDGDVWFVTDEAVPAGHDDVSVLACGVPATNAALQSVERAPRTDGGEVVRLRIAAFGPVPAVSFTVQVDGAVPTRHQANVVDGLADAVVPLPAGADVVAVALQDDALAIDNVAWILPEDPRTVGVADALPQALRQELALDRVFAALPAWRVAPSAAAAQLLLRCEPGPVADGQVEVVLLPGTGERKALTGPFVVDRAMPWLQGVSLQGVVWVAGEAELPGQVLVAAGPHTLASEEPLEHGRRLWLRVQGSTGNVVRAPDWPVLFANVLDSCRADVPGPECQQVLVGSEARFRRAPGAAEAPPVLLCPDGSQQQGGASRTVGWVIGQPGVHRVLGPDGEPLGRFAARFHDPSESDLRGLTTFARRGQPPAAAVKATPLRDTGFEPRVLAWLVVLLLALDWWILARRDA